MHYGKRSSVSIALCIRVYCGDGHNIILGAGEIFKKMFSAVQHIDVLLLDEQAEGKLSRVCGAFYNNETPDIEHR